MTTRYGMGHGLAAIVSIAGTTVMAGLFGLIALRATGLGFLMITLALSQVLWGLAYRMSNVTNGDNGVAGLTRPMPLGIPLEILFVDDGANRVIADVRRRSCGGRGVVARGLLCNAGRGHRQASALARLAR